MVLKAKVFRLLVCLSFLQLLKSEPCDLILENQSVIILDITESIGDDYGQSTYPKELPINGDRSTIQLKFSEENHLFRIEDKTLHLTKVLDRDKDELSTIRFELNCLNLISGRMKSIPVILRIEDQNDNRPVFAGNPYTVILSEDTPVGSAVFKDIRAVDTDASVNGQVIYEIIDILPDENIFDIRFPHQGILYLNAPLDHERVTSYEITILATDLALHPIDRLNSSATLTIQVQDIDDQDPVFDTAALSRPCSSDVPLCAEAFEYHSSIIEGQLDGVLDVYPTRIHAIDPDAMGSKIVYSFGPGTPSFRNYFEIDSRTAVIRQIKAVKMSEIKHFQITIEATEQSDIKRKTSVDLLIVVKGVDTSPPKIVAPSLSGMVQEGSPKGTSVLRDDGSGEPFILYVTDPDYSSKENLPKYKFELTTNDFEITSGGIIIVSNPNLDRDPPNRAVLAFQAIAREVDTGVASAPVSLTVALRDVNDNYPRIPVYPTISIPAGSERRILQKIQADDIDEGDNARVRFFLTKDAEGRFSIDTLTGDIVSEGNLNSGEQFQLEMQVTDSGGLSGIGLLDVVVSKGPNTNGPIFTKARYTAAIPEDTQFGAKILTVEARDPEEDTPYYSIVSGKGKEIFEIDTLSGVVSVVAPLDRETTDHYEMVVQAQDSEGVSNSAAITIRIIDVNDQAPEFVGLPYSFRVDEGNAESFVGVVKAHDTDLNKAGMVFYDLLNDNKFFKIDPVTGEIFTAKALDYEKEQAHYIPVLAMDKSVDSLSSTATVTVLVNDLSDELPHFLQSFIHVSITENSPIGTMVTSVTAEDPDTQKSITYVLKEESKLFKIDSHSGRITLVGKIDYEKISQHQLTIGTEENSGVGENDQITVNISVVDLNDFGPRISKYKTITIPQNAPVGSLLLTVAATDEDGTTPNNKISYSMSGLPAINYFEINKESGEIKLKRSMNKINTTEILVSITAKDGGQPPLQDSTEFVVLLLKGGLGTSDNSIERNNGQIGKVILASFPRFLRERMEKRIREDHPMEKAILKVPLVNASTSISCSILDGDSEGYFEVYVSQDRNCILQLIKSLDYEAQRNFLINLVLHPSSVSLSAVIQDELLILSESQVSINVENLNDNPPVFSVLPTRKPAGLEENNILSFVLETADPNSPVFTLMATDADESDDTGITYVLDPQSNRGNYFTFDERKNLMMTRRQLRNVPANLLPFNLTVIATDKPDIDGTVRSTYINVIVPVIEEEHRSVLVIRSPKEFVEAKKSSILDVLSESSGSFAHHEMTKQYRKSDGEPITNFYFHFLSPSWMPRTFEKIGPSETKQIIQKIVNIDGINSAILIPRNQLTAKKPEEILESQEKAIQTEREVDKDKLGTAVIFGPAEYVFLVMAAAIIIFVIVATFIICLLWSRFHSKWNAADKRLMLLPPLLDRPPSAMDGFAKEYEIQVLHMSIPLDEDSTPELPSSSSHQYFLDNVSYISKAQTGNDESSEESHSGRNSPRIPYTVDTKRFPQMHSLTNDNVMFVRKPVAGPSLVETTTEL